MSFLRESIGSAKAGDKPTPWEGRKTEKKEVLIMGRGKKTVAQSENIPFRRLVYEALPEMWSFQFWVGLILTAAAWGIRRLISVVAEAGGAVATTANLRGVLLSWRGPVLLILGTVLVLLFIVLELFAHILMNRDVLNGETASVRKEVGEAFRSTRRFLTPAGIPILLYIFIAVPLCGLGFSISMTSAFHIPNFIMDVVMATPLYAVAYIALIMALLWFGFRSIFSVHAVLLDGMTPTEGRKKSVRIIRAHGRAFAWGMFKVLLVMGLIQGVVILLGGILEGVVGALVPSVPEGYYFDIKKLLDTGMTEMDVAAVKYRSICAFTVFFGSLVRSIAVLLCGAYTMLRFTRYYLAYSREGEPEGWRGRPKRAKYFMKALSVLGLSLVSLAAAVLVGFSYDNIYTDQEKPKIIAHRTGGAMASENSLEGLELAIAHGCYGSETDIQRTKDGRYIVNHDNDFKRLTGVAKTPGEMTIGEIEELRIRDTTGNGQELEVVTIEEMLDVVPGRIKLFIELKGASADRQMVDDIVKLVRERDMVDDVALISLNYAVIDYAETNYPEFETGTLFFAGLGNVANLNCDLLIMEEEMGTRERIGQIHAAGKEAIVWTVNTESGMQRFLDSAVDGVITDEVELAERVREELDARPVIRVIRDRFGDLWE